MTLCNKQPLSKNALERLRQRKPHLPPARKKLLNPHKNPNTALKRDWPTAGYARFQPAP